MTAVEQGTHLDPIIEIRKPISVANFLETVERFLS